MNNEPFIKSGNFGGNSYDQPLFKGFSALADQTDPAPKPKQKPASKLEEHKRQEKQQQAELKRHFEEAVGGEEPWPTGRVPETSKTMYDESGQKTGYYDKGIIYDVQGNIVDEVPLEAPDLLLDPDLWITLGAGGATRGFQRGIEFRLGKNFKIAPFGNRAGHPTGKWPHYHRSKRYKTGRHKGEVMRDQGQKRHRPWDDKPSDNHWWDKF